MNSRLRIGMLWAAAILVGTSGCGPIGDGESSDGETTSDLSPSGSAQQQGVSFQVPGRDFRTAPPKISAMQLFPNQPARTDGKALLEATIDEDLPKLLNFVWKGEATRLRDDGEHGDRVAHDRIYSAWIDVDTESISKNAAASRIAAKDAAPALARTPGGITVPLLGRNLTAANVAGSPSAAVTSGLTTLLQLDPDDPLFIDPERSLLIRDLTVVNDSLRTDDPCRVSSPGSTSKKWSFGYLLQQMADDATQAGTQKTPSQFALDWLNRWSSYSPTVNGQSLAQQPGLSTRNTPATIKAKWLRASGSQTTVAMNKAPFRLLAIVNRLDLRDNLSFGAGKAGELRFVFAVLDNDVREPVPNAADPCALLDIQENTSPTLGARPSHTVILEYAVHKNSEEEVFAWAQEWQKLSTMTIGSVDYLNQLQSLTESVVTAGKGAAGQANGSALIRIRTNQSLNNTMWELREFEINKTVGSAYRYSPVPVTVKQTPQGITATANNNRNETWNLGKWISTNLDSVDVETHNVPNALPSGQGYHSPLSGFLGARAVTSGQNGPTSTGYWEFLGYWVPSGGWLDYNDPRHVNVRHQFSKNTCNGCHGSETRPQGLPNHVAVFHIEPRTYGQRSNLSNFLTGLPPGEDPPSENYVNVPDPIVPSVERHFNDLAERALDMKVVLFFGPTAALAFQPSGRTH